MRLQILKEAKYTGGEKGSFDWILNNFCKKPNTERGMRYYEVDMDKYIVLFSQQYVVREFEIDRGGNVYVFPIIGEAISTTTNDIEWKITVLRKDILHPG